MRLGNELENSRRRDGKVGCLETQWRLLGRNNLSRNGVLWIDRIEYIRFNESVRPLARLSEIGRFDNAVAEPWAPLPLLPRSQSLWPPPDAHQLPLE
jgi:hypothetical protein